MLLHIYFAGKFLKNFLLTLSIFIIFMFLIDLIEQLRKFAESVDFIEVFDNPSIDFDVNNPTSCNPPLIVDFHDNTLNINDWFWEMENGFISR